jgi:hypothetical protein
MRRDSSISADATGEVVFSCSSTSIQTMSKTVNMAGPPHTHIGRNRVRTTTRYRGKAMHHTACNSTNRHLCEQPQQQPVPLQQRFAHLEAVELRVSMRERVCMSECVSE